jgi:hypothetical protein
MLLASPLRYPPISDLAEPMLRLASVRINPQNNTPHAPLYWVGLSLMKLPDGVELSISLPPGVRAGFPIWNAPGTRIAFTSVTASSVSWRSVDSSIAGSARAAISTVRGSERGANNSGPPAKPSKVPRTICGWPWCSSTVCWTNNSADSMPGWKAWSGAMAAINGWPNCLGWMRTPSREAERSYWAGKSFENGCVRWEAVGRGPKKNA